MSEAFTSRAVKGQFLSQEQAEGVGARVRRSIGRPELRHFDPFLMLDEFFVKKPAGFADHPHRGFETVTYMLEGRFQHEDFVGHRGLIGPGDLQWMTAGRGVVHAEMPETDSTHGLQLWVNLAAKDKMCEPAYQELLAKDVPRVTKDGVTAIIIAGDAFGVSSPVYTRTPTHYLHFIMEKNKELNQPIPAGWNSFIYVLEGEALIGSNQKRQVAHTTVLLDNSDHTGVTVKTGDTPCSFVLLAGRPNNEPIVQHGPFVMNTQQEIIQAFNDYRMGRNGFEKAPAFLSKIARGLMDD